jgi:hypothetical protein
MRHVTRIKESDPGRETLNVRAYGCGACSNDKGQITNDILVNVNDLLVSEVPNVLGRKLAE